MTHPYQQPPAGRPADHWAPPRVPAGVAGPTAAPQSMAPPAVSPVPRRRGQHGAGTVVALVVLGILLLVALGVIGAQVGADAFPLAGVLALVPLVLVLLAVRWVDRWEPEPWQALAVAFGWGASVSVLVALVLNTGAMLVMVAVGSTGTAAEVWGATAVAPVVEETIKAVGVLLVFLVWRRSFNGPVDGLVYAATVAAGFAFVENILYFGSTMAATAGTDGAGEAVVAIFMMRGLMSPFAHLLFTACTGLALGLAAERSRFAWLWAFPLGLLFAVVLHGLWNGSTFVAGGTGFMSLYIAFQVPLFLATVGLAFWLRRREAQVVRARLLEYAAALWFAPAEVTMLASLRERRRARAWAADRAGTEGKQAMQQFQVAATRLAYLRQRAQSRRGDGGAARDESTALEDLAAARARLLAALAR